MHTLIVLVALLAVPLLMKLVLMHVTVNVVLEIVHVELSNLVALSMVDLQAKVSNLEKSNCMWIILFVSLINYCSSSSLFHCSFVFVVCRDGSCTGPDSCLGATIGSVVGPSCTELGSCLSAQFNGVDLINSCNAKVSCNSANGNEVFDELIDCCNKLIEIDFKVKGQCQSKGGLDIVDVGCVSVLCNVLTAFVCLFICQMTHFLSIITY